MSDGSWLEANEDRLVWIFGSSRSGSTWLLKMLAEFPGVVPVDDPHLGHHLGVWRPLPLAWATSETPPELTTLLDVKADEPGYLFAEHRRESWWTPLRRLIQARFEAEATGVLAPPAGERTVVVKEPGSHAAPLIAELFPRSKIIFLLRDGRDVVDSWLSAYREGTWAIPGGAFPVSDEGRPALIRWLSAVWAFRSRAVRQAFETRAEEDRILVRYEALRCQTPEHLEAIASMAGLDPGTVREVAAAHSFEGLATARRGPGKAVRSARPGSWRDNLTAAEQEVMHEALEEALIEFGYDPSPVETAAAA
jgi:hypothetical protein